MATLEQLQNGLIKADAAGNVEDARAFADEIRKMRSAPIAEAPQQSTMDKVWQGVKDLSAGYDSLKDKAAAGLGRGLKDVIDTGAQALATGYDKITGADAPTLSSLITGQKQGEGARIRAMNEAGKADYAKNYGDSNVAGGFRLGGNILATAPIGGALGGAAQVARLPNALVQALRTGGMSTGGATGAGGVAARLIGGAGTGAASAAAINPEDAGMGAVVGAVLPGGAMLLGKGAQKVGAIYRNLVPTKEANVANKFAAAVGLTPEELRQAVSIQAPSMIPGYEATVPQILQNPVASQIQRNLKASGSVSLGNAERSQQSAYRGAMENIAPIDLSVQDAANRAGNAVQDYAKPAYQEAGAKVNKLFESVNPEDAKMYLPLQEMQNAQNKYLGAGSFGKGGASVEQAMNAATNIGMNPLNKFDKQVVPFDQLQNLRGSLNTAMADAAKNNQAQPLAALKAMKDAIDNKIAAVASGERQAGEVFTPEAIDAWGRAINAHAAKKLQFNTGPQAGMFRQGADGQSAIQGAEIPGKFYNGNRSQVEDVKAFKNLIGNRADLADEMKRYAMTEGASTSNQFGDLTSKFTKWMQSRSGANRELFTEQENATLREVGKAVERSMMAENLARSTGSDTAQKIKTMESMGMLDNKFVNGLVSRTPVVGKYLDAGLLSLKNTASQAQSNELARLLASPQAMQQALSKKQITQQEANMLTKLLQQGSYRAAPALIAQ